MKPRCYFTNINKNRSIMTFCGLIILILITATKLTSAGLFDLNMTLTSTYSDSTYPGTLDATWEMIIDENRMLTYLFAWADSSLTILNVSDADIITYHGGATDSSPPGSINGASFGSLDSQNNIIYIAAYSSDSISIYNVSNQSTNDPTPLGSTNTISSNTSEYNGSLDGIYDVDYVDVGGNRFLIAAASLDDQLSVYNVTDPAITPVPVSYITNASNPCTVDSVQFVKTIPGTNKIIVVSYADETITILNLSSTGQLYCINNYTKADAPYSTDNLQQFYFENETNLLYVPSPQDSSLAILNISNLPAIQTVGSINNAVNLSSAVSVTIGKFGSEKYAFIGSALAGKGIKVINVTNPANPTYLQTFNQTSGACTYNVIYSLSVVREYLYANSYNDDCFYVIQVYGGQHTIIANQPQRFVRATNTSVELTVTGNWEVKPVLFGPNGTTDYTALLYINFTQQIDARNMTGNTSRQLRKAFIHNTTAIPRLVSLNLLIPKVQGSNRVYICPNATSFDQIYQLCPGKISMVLGETTNGMTMSNATYDGYEYYIVTNITGTGGAEDNPPIMYTSRINPSLYASPNQNLTGFCNATDFDNNSVYYQYTWYKNGVAYIQDIAIANGSLSIGSTHACAIRANDSTIMCWGLNTNGQLAIGTETGTYYTPQSSTNTERWNKIVSGATRFSCAIRTNDSTIHCWGRDNQGQLGNGAPTDNQPTPQPITTTAKFSKIAAASGAACAIRTNDSTIHCWGENTYGQLGNGTVGGSQHYPTQINSSEQFLNIFSSPTSHHFCAIRANDSTVKCWGINTEGQLGNGSTGSNQPNPTPINSTAAYLQISTARFHTCAILANTSTTQCWGTNSVGQLGTGDTTARNTPTNTLDQTPKLKLISAYRTTCAIRTNDSTIHCWGSNAFGLLGNGSVGGDNNTGTPINTTGQFIDISMGGTEDSTSHLACAIRANDTRTICWGDNTNGLFANGSAGSPISNPTSYNETAYAKAYNQSVETQIPAIIYSNFTSLGENWTLRCNAHDGYFMGSELNSTPTFIIMAVPETTGARINPPTYAYHYENLTGYCNATQFDVMNNTIMYELLKNGTIYYQGFSIKNGSLSAGSYHTCAIRANDSRAMCWGYNSNGQLGIGNTSQYRLPIDVSGAHQFKSISAGEAYTCAIRSNDSLVMCWGENTFGKTGMGTPTGNTLVPTVITDNSPYLSVVAGVQHTCGIRANDSRVLCWGYNVYGQIGNGSAGGSQYWPTLVEDTSPYKDISLSIYNTCGIRANDSRVLCWGPNSVGQLGIGNSSEYPYPILINDSGPYISLARGLGNYVHSGIRANDSLAMAWGRNFEYQAGFTYNDPSVWYRKNPTRFNSSDQFLKISQGYYHGCAIRKNDSRLYCWGTNDDSQLGTGYPSPDYNYQVIVNDTNKYIDVSAGYYHTCAVRDDGQVMCWGRNNNGQLGMGDTTQRNYSTPINSTIQFINANSTGETIIRQEVDSQYTTTGENWTLVCRAANYYGISDPVNTTVQIISTCTYRNYGNWTIFGSDNCNITSHVDMGRNNVFVQGPGTVLVPGNITNYTLRHLYNGVTYRKGPAS